MKDRFASFVAVAALAAVAATGCSSQHLYRSLYATGDGWQRSQCDQLADAGSARQRCLTRPDTSYDAYERQASAPAQR